MRYRVVKRFWGRREQRQFEEGDVVEMTKERHDEIVTLLPGYLSPARERKQEEKGK